MNFVEHPAVSNTNQHFYLYSLIKHPKPKTDRSHLSSTRVKNDWDITSTFLISFNDLVLGHTEGLSHLPVQVCFVSATAVSVMHSITPST